MAYFNFINGETLLNDTNLMAMQKGLMELVFPIGSTYITQSNTNPNTILGFGTWERLKGKIAVGLDEDDEDEYFDEIGKTGGEKSHTLTINEMPSHRHEREQTGRALYWDSDLTSMGGLATGDNVQSSWSTNTTNVGGGQSHNNVQPYEVVGYMWIRRS